MGWRTLRSFEYHMSQTRLEWKVGLFVFIALVLMAGLLIKFSKGASFFTPSYEVLLKTRSVGGIKKGAGVLMAGVPVGSVASAELTPDGRDVVVHLRILRQYSIHADALFAIEQSGFLGDQYVSIVTGRNTGPLLKDGSLITCQEPFNLQEAARAVAGFLQRVDITAQKLNDAVARLDRTLLSEENLTNLTTTVANFRTISEKTLRTVDHIEGVVETNAPGIAAGVSNLVEFSQELDRLGRSAGQWLGTNQNDLTAAVKNIDSASAMVNHLATDLQAGKGLAGSLLKDTQMQTQLGQTVSNMSVLSSNLARFGLLYKPRPVKTNVVARPLLSPARNR